MSKQMTSIHGSGVNGLMGGLLLIFGIPILLLLAIQMVLNLFAG